MKIALVGAALVIAATQTTAAELQQQNLHLAASNTKPGALVYPDCDPPHNVSGCPTATVNGNGKITTGKELLNQSKPFIIEDQHGRKFMVNPLQ